MTDAGAGVATTGVAVTGAGVATSTAGAEDATDALLVLKYGAENPKLFNSNFNPAPTPQVDAVAEGDTAAAAPPASDRVVCSADTALATVKPKTPLTKPLGMHTWKNPSPRRFA